MVIIQGTTLEQTARGAWGQEMAREQKKLEFIRYSQLPIGSVIKIGFVVNVGVWLPVGLLLGILGSMGFDTLTFNGVHVHGAKALIGGPIFTTVIVIVGILVTVLGALAISLIRRLADRIQIPIFVDEPVHRETLD